jgi:hypothetical protein
VTQTQPSPVESRSRRVGSQGMMKEEEQRVCSAPTEGASNRERVEVAGRLARLLCRERKHWFSSPLRQGA